MSIWQRFRDVLTFQEPLKPPFELINEKEREQAAKTPAGKPSGDGNEKSPQPGQDQKQPPSPEHEERSVKGDRPPRPGKNGGRKTFKHTVRANLAKKDQPAEPRANAILQEGAPLSVDLEDNKSFLKQVFRKPKNKDIIFREFSLNTSPRVKALIIYYDGLTDTQLQNLSLLQPLMLLAGLRADDDGRLSEKVAERLLPGNQVEYVVTYRELVEGIVQGNTGVLLDGCANALVVETKGWEHRGIEKPENESTVMGPQNAFSESFRANTAQIRKCLHTPALVTEVFKMGSINRCYCAMMYLDDLASPKLVDEVRRRVESIEVDFLYDTGTLESFIQDHPYALSPQILSTERPDRVVANLVEGKVALLLDGSPYALIVPSSFFTISQSAEDVYLRWPYGSFIRVVRMFGLLVGFLLPGLYVAIVTFHHEMIPTDLLMSMAGAREQVPFPTIVELLIMEAAFELIREAAVRVPGVVGVTLGIVGALILGQAAVAANIVSPILIIIVALTAIGNFTVVNFTLATAVRATRFAYIILGATLGIFGIITGLFLHVSLMANMKSFGVPYLAPLAPAAASNTDFLVSSMVWQHQETPDQLNPQKRRRQPKISRGWVKQRLGKGGGKHDQ
jgi:spore germination protein KA